MEKSERERISAVVVRAFAGDSIKDIGSFTCFQFFAPKEQAVLVYDASGAKHKYVIAECKHCRSVLALPLTLIELHKDILKLYELAAGKAKCRGGGYVEFRGAALWTGGSSQDFGAGDHEFAKLLLERAVFEGKK